MVRPLRRHVDEQILDRAAGLFARHGFAHTSLKDLADAVGLSKAGLLHHYPSKEALFDAAQEMGRAHSRRVLEQVLPLPSGPARDRRAVELLVDFALDRPGLIALASRAISALGAGDRDGAHDGAGGSSRVSADGAADSADNGSGDGGRGADGGLDGADRFVFSVFEVDPDAGGTERLVRVVGMLGALAVLSLSANHEGDKTGWRPHIITTCLDALGHRGPRAGASQVEA